MKHLKRFNESFVDVSDIKDFCETNLAYLLDDGMEVDTDDSTYKKSKGLGVYLTDISKPWFDIKDQIIPFFTRLNKEYNLGLIYNDEDWTVGFYLKDISKENDDDTYYYSMDEIIDEGVGHDDEYDGTNSYDDTLNKEGVIVDNILFYIKSKKGI